MNDTRSRLRGALWLAAAVSAFAADLPGSKDPPGMKRYEGSEIIGYRAPRFDEFLLPLGPQTFAVDYQRPNLIDFALRT